MSFWQLDPETSGSTSVVHPEDFDCKAKNVKVSIKEEEETAHSKRISRQHASTDSTYSSWDCLPPAYTANRHESMTAPTKGWITSSPSAHARPQRQLTFSRLPAPNKVQMRDDESNGYGQEKITEQFLSCQWRARDTVGYNDVPCSFLFL